MRRSSVQTPPSLFLAFLWSDHLLIFLLQSTAST
uniref:Uncharacterized protein n=1 Tax=Anguilla anguilla TaxID=7936 RepID=A0A0E9T6D0_ANGAN